MQENIYNRAKNASFYSYILFKKKKKKSLERLKIRCHKCTKLLIISITLVIPALKKRRDASPRTTFICIRGDNHDAPV